MKKVSLPGLFGVVWLGMAGVGLVAPAVAAAEPVSATGVVQQLKPEQNKVKINHDPIEALGWPSMSMYFRVKDQAVLDGIGVGDKVQFQLEKGAGGLEITRMEKAAK